MLKFFPVSSRFGVVSQKAKRGFDRGPAVALGMVALCLWGLPSAVFGASLILLEGEWRFFPVQVADQNLAATETERAQRFGAAEFDDSSWETVPVPGYWDKAPGSRPWSNPKVESGPHPNHNGEAWYRRTFEIPAESLPPGSPSQPGSFSWIAELEFDAVAAQASVWVNGTFVGRHLGAFSPFSLPVSPQILKPGGNVVAVRVRDKSVFQSGPPVGDSPGGARIPLGYSRNWGGIWRPARLRIAPRERWKEIRILPGVDSVTLELEVSEEAVGTSTAVIEIEDPATGQKIYGPRSQGVKASAAPFPGLVARVTEFAREVRPKPWSPESPSLYTCRATLINSAGARDTREVSFGFRTFEVRGNQFLLNGQPYFLFGAGSPPHYEDPSDEVGIKHLEKLKEAGVRMVRFAYEPPAEKWLSWCDRIGLLAWIEGAICADEGPYDFADRGFVNNATREAIATVRSLRNHPSAAIWSMGSWNLLSISSQEGKETARQVLAGMAEMVAQINRPKPSEVGAATGYPRLVALAESDSRLSVSTPFEDWQTSLGWYHGKTSDWVSFLETVADKDARTDVPWVCSGIVTGYSTASQGRIVPYPVEETASRMRIGAPAEERAPLLDYQARRIRRMLEEARTLRNPDKFRIAGLFPFTSENWFFNPLTPSAMQPKPVLAAIRQAYRPVLVTVQLPREHYYQNDPRGEIPSATVTVVNDLFGEGPQPSGTLTFEVVTAGDTGSTVTQRTIPPVPYGSSASYPFYLTLPEVKGLATADIRVRLASEGKEISASSCTIRIGALADCLPKPEDLANDVLLYDPGQTLAAVLAEFKIKPPAFDKLEQLSKAAGLWIGPEGFDDYVARSWPVLEKWVSAGGRVVVFPQVPVETLWEFSGPYPGKMALTTPEEGWPTGIDAVNLRIEDHPLFSGLGPDPLREWGNSRVVARHVLDPPVGGEAPPSHRFLADMVPSMYALDWKGVVAEVSIGEGKVILSQLEILENVRVDPIAGLLLRNICQWVGGAARPILADIPQDATDFLEPLVGNQDGEIRARRAGIGQNDSVRAVKIANGSFDVTRETDLSGTEIPGLLPQSANEQGERPIHYDIDDRFWYDEAGPAEVEVQVYCLEPSQIRLDYDSTDKVLANSGPYKPTTPPHSVLETGMWKTLVFSLPDARFAGRQPENCDFRLVTLKGRAIYGPLVVRKLAPKK